MCSLGVDFVMCLIQAVVDDLTKAAEADYKEVCKTKKARSDGSAVVDEVQRFVVASDLCREPLLA